jgi:hypothetical protein
MTWESMTMASAGWWKRSAEPIWTTDGQSWVQITLIEEPVKEGLKLQ